MVNGAMCAFWSAFNDYIKDRCFSVYVLVEGFAGRIRRKKCQELSNRMLNTQRKPVPWLGCHDKKRGEDRKVLPSPQGVGRSRTSDLQSTPGEGAPGNSP